MSNKGFTVIELISTFAIASVIAIVLLNVVLSIKNVYSISNIKTDLLINQANLSNQINSKSIESSIISVDYCNKSNYCYTITYSDGTSYDLVIKENFISFGNYVYKLDKNSHVDESNILLIHETDATVLDNTEDSIFRIKIPIINKNHYNQDFGIDYLYLYNSGDINFNSIP